MGEVEPKTRPPSLSEANQIVADWEREVGALDTNHPLRQLAESVRRLQMIETYCTTGSSTQTTRDVVAMAVHGAWSPR